MVHECGHDGAAEVSEASWFYRHAARARQGFWPLRAESTGRFRTGTVVPDRPARIERESHRGLAG